MPSVLSGTSPRAGWEKRLLPIEVIPTHTPVLPIRAEVSPRQQQKLRLSGSKGTPTTEERSAEDTLEKIRGVL